MIRPLPNRESTPVRRRDLDDDDTVAECVAFFVDATPQQGPETHLYLLVLQRVVED